MFAIKRPPLFVSLPVAVILYAVFAAVLFWPYQSQLISYKRLFPLETIIASAGVFVLCRRWVLSFFASLAGGAVYGFGTYACSLLCYHPFAGLVYALLPWTFVPAVFFYRWANLDRLNTKIISGLLVLLPILFILAAYNFAAKIYFYPLPANSHLLFSSLLGVIDPIGQKSDAFAFGFYHVCIAGLVMGFAVLLQTGRFGIIFLFAAALFAAFYKPFLNVPPAVWAAPAVLICSVLIASGLETIILAGPGDAKWLVATVGILLMFSVADVFITHHHSVIPISAALYGMSAVSLLAIYFIAGSNLSWHLLRMFILYAAVFIDIFVSTKHNIDIIF